MNMLVVFLRALADLVIARNGGLDNDIAKLLRLGMTGAQLAEQGKTGLEEAVAKVQQLVAEDRSLTDEESKALDASIQSKLDAIAAIKVGGTD